jgi:hypothetical protein
MKKWFVSAVACTVALAAAVAGSAHPTATSRAQARPALVVPYLSHGAGVWVEGRTGRPVAVAGAAAPATPGVHYARR